MEELVYKVIDSKIQDIVNKEYDENMANITMITNINKYIGDLKVVDGKNVNLIKPTEKDMIMYLIYLLHKQKVNDIDALDNIQKIVDFKIDVHNGELNKEEIDALIDVYRVQIKLK